MPTPNDTRYQKQWKLDASRGIKRTVPAGKARLHIATLQGAGWSLRAIAGAAGCSPGVISLLARGEQTRLKRTTATLILAIDPAQVPSAPSSQTREPFVPRVGTVRRIQALLAIGWTHRHMTDRCGIRTHILLSQQGRWVTRSTHDAVAAMYRELSMKPGPSERTRQRAATRGYAGPASWDDIDLDDAPEKPEELCAADGCLNTAQWTYDPTRRDERALMCRRHQDEEAA